MRPRGKLHGRVGVGMRKEEGEGKGRYPDDKRLQLPFCPLVINLFFIFHIYVTIHPHLDLIIIKLDGPLLPLDLTEKPDVGKVKYELHVYDNGHAFSKPTNPNYTKEICDFTFGRMIDFMKKQI